MVWLRAEPNSQVFLHYSKESSLGDFSSIGPFPVDGEADYTALIKLEKLEPATTYYYRAAVAGKQPGYVARFVTAPKPDDAAKVSFCCSGDTRESYKPFTVMNAVHAQHPDFFLHLGDTIYADRAARRATCPSSGSNIELTAMMPRPNFVSMRSVPMSLGTIMKSPTTTYRETLWRP